VVRGRNDSDIELTVAARSIAPMPLLDSLVSFPTGFDLIRQIWLNPQKTEETDVLKYA
jgi:hypothetical protein